MRASHPALSAPWQTARVPIAALGDVWEPAPIGISPEPSPPPLADPGASLPSSVGYSWTQAATAAGTQVVQAAASGQNPGQAAAIAGVATAGQIAAGMSTAAWAVPVIGAAVAGVTIWLASIFRRNAQKEAATRIVNEIEPKLQENLRAYFSGPRTTASQAQALANFDAAWQAMQQACRNSQLGSAGERCISDRQQGACTWRARCSQQIDGVCVDYALDPNGECWNWFVGYRDPIASDPVPARKAASGTDLSLIPGAAGAGSGSPLLLVAGAALLAVAAIYGGKE